MAARTQAEIKQLLDELQAAETALASLDNDSQTAEFELWKDLFANNQNLLEQLWDIKEQELNAIIALAAPATPAWIKDKVEKFQYSATSPQFLQIIPPSFLPQYFTIDETLRIITRCSVKTLGNNTVQVKVAKDEPPTTLSVAEASTMTGYLSDLLPAGIAFNLINVAADKLYIEADVYYNGQYSPTIVDDVISSIETYLANLPPDGVVEVSEIQNVINDTPGVNDVKIITIKARKDATAFGSATIIYDLNTSINILNWPTFSASIVEETTVGQTFADKINFIVS